jgi:uncharacterized membrane protein YeaQ/YmgE (transglycosylase-associated protein family)
LPGRSPFPFDEGLDLYQNRPALMSQYHECQMLVQHRSNEMSILWTILIGFIVGVIAKFIMPGDKTEPKGFILTAILGIVGAFVATYLGQAVGWYGPGESAGIIGGIIGAIIVLFVYGLIAGRQGRLT